MSDELVTRVARWLDAVPHAAECYEVNPTRWLFRCSCDRAQRQAEAVVRLARNCIEVGTRVMLIPGGPRCDPVVAALDAVEREAAPQKPRKLVETQPERGKDGALWRTFALVPMDDPRPPADVPDHGQRHE